MLSNNTCMLWSCFNAWVSQIQIHSCSIFTKRKMSNTCNEFANSKKERELLLAAALLNPYVKLILSDFSKRMRKKERVQMNDMQQGHRGQRGQHEENEETTQWKIKNILGTEDEEGEQDAEDAIGVLVPEANYARQKLQRELAERMGHEERPHKRDVTHEMMNYREEGEDETCPLGHQLKMFYDRHYSNSAIAKDRHSVIVAALHF